MLLLGGLAGGVVAWLVTGWLLALVAVPVAAVGLPMLLSSASGRGPRSSGSRRWRNGPAPSPAS